MSLISTVTPILAGVTCLPIAVSVSKDFWDADKLWVGLAAFFGFLLGCGISFACSVVCIKSWKRKRMQDEEEAWMLQNNIPAHKRHMIDGDDESEYDEVEEVIVTEDQYIIDEDEGGKKKKPKKGKKKKRQDDDEEDETAFENLPDGNHLDSSLLDALLKSNGDAINMELTSQDLQEITRLEVELWDEKITLLIFLIRKLVEKHVEKGVITQEFATTFIDRFEKQLKDIRVTCLQEQKEAEEELEKRDDLKKSPTKLEKEKENLHSRTIAKMHSTLNSEKEAMYKEMKKSDMTDEEIDAIMTRLTQDMEKCERHLNDEARRQAQVLEERLARRRHLAEKMQAEKEQSQMAVTTKTELHNTSLTGLVDENKLLERQKDDLLDQYESNLQRIHGVQEDELQRQQLALAEKLKKKRELQMRKLDLKQAQDRENFIKKADKTTSTAETVQSYQTLLQQQRVEREAAITEFDSEEVSQLKTLRQEANTEIQELMEKEDQDFMDDLETKAELSKKDISRLIKLNQQQAEEFERVKEAEKKKMNAKLKEKLAQRKQKIEEEDLKNRAEEQSTREQQENTLKIVLDQQLELTEEAKNRIMLEHNENMQAMNNQLNMSRLRQKKQLEAKLNARRAKVTDLKQKQEAAKHDKRRANEKEQEKLQMELQQQIEKEEKRFEQEHQDAMADLRQRLAAETEAAIKEQDEKLSALIGRLQVGQARRQAIISKQNKTLEELQDQMANKVSETGAPLRGADQILQQHHNQVEQLTDKLQEDKDRQERLLKERLEAKKLKREREIEEKIDEESQQEWEAIRQRGAGNASTVLVQMMMEQKHKRAMDELEREMELEMQKQRDSINRNLEAEMRKELQDQQKQFLAHIAAVSDLSKNEIDEVVENAVSGGGGNEKQAQKLAKEMRTEVKRAKSAYGGRRDADRDEDTQERRGSPESDEDMPRARPKSSGKKKRPKSGAKGD